MAIAQPRLTEQDYEAFVQSGVEDGSCTMACWCRSRG